MSALSNLSGYTHPGVLSNIRGNAADKPLLVEQAAAGAGVLKVSLTSAPPVGAAAFLWQTNFGEVCALDWNGQIVDTYVAASSYQFMGVIGALRTIFSDGSTVDLCDITTQTLAVTQAVDSQEGVPSPSITNDSIFMAGFAFDPVYDRRLSTADIDLGSITIVGFAVPVPSATVQFESDFDLCPASVDGYKIAVGTTSFITWQLGQTGLVSVPFASGYSTDGGGGAAPRYAVNSTQIVRGIQVADLPNASIEIADLTGAQVQLVQLSTDPAITRFIGLVADDTQAVAVITDETNQFAYYIDLASYAVTDISALFTATDPAVSGASSFRPHQSLI